MIEEARKTGGILHVNKQFFWLPALVLTPDPIPAGVLGKVPHATNFRGHFGSSAVWQTLAGETLHRVNAIEHRMPLPRQQDGAARRQESEVLQLRANDGHIKVVDRQAMRAGLRTSC